MHILIILILAVCILTGIERIILLPTIYAIIVVIIPKLIFKISNQIINIKCHSAGQFPQKTQNFSVYFIFLTIKT